MMDFFEAMNAAQNTVTNIAKALLSMEASGVRTVFSECTEAFANTIQCTIEDEVLRQASLAMIGEEICAKKRTSVTDFFNHIATANDDTDLSFLEKAIFDIATLVVGGREEALNLFEILGPMSVAVLDECGEYDGGF